jgi:hypothetical protein
MTKPVLTRKFGQSRGGPADVVEIVAHPEVFRIRNARFEVVFNLLSDLQGNQAEDAAAIESKKTFLIGLEHRRSPPKCAD